MCTSEGPSGGAWVLGPFPRGIWNELFTCRSALSMAFLGQNPSLSSHGPYRKAHSPGDLQSPPSAAWLLPTCLFSLISHCPLLPELSEWAWLFLPTGCGCGLELSLSLPTPFLSSSDQPFPTLEALPEGYFFQEDFGCIKWLINEHEWSLSFS